MTRRHLTRGMGQRMNRLVRWGGLAVCAVVAGAYVANVWWVVGWNFNGRVEAICGSGAFGLTALPSANVNVRLGSSLGSSTMRRPDGVWIWWFHSTRIAGVGTIQASSPLWCPLLLAAAPTALSWRSELRRRRRDCINHCNKCGYDLAGLAKGGACPECGKA